MNKHPPSMPTLRLVFDSSAEVVNDQVGTGVEPGSMMPGVIDGDPATEGDGTTIIGSDVIPDVSTGQYIFFDAEAEAEGGSVIAAVAVAVPKISSFPPVGEILTAPDSIITNNNVVGITSPSFSSISGSTSRTSSNMGCSSRVGTSDDSIVGGTSNLSTISGSNYNNDLSVINVNTLQSECSTSEAARVSIDQVTDLFEAVDEHRRKSKQGASFVWQYFHI